MKFPHRFYSLAICVCMLSFVSGCWQQKENISEKTIMQLLPTQGSMDLAGCDLHYKTFGSGAPIIVLHGGPGMDHEYLLPQMRWLATDHEVTFYDQRGSGRSWNTAINEETMTMERFVDDLEALRERLRYERFTLIGHSWGGMLAMQYAIAHPEHLSALVLMDSIPATSTGYQAFLTESNQRTADLKVELEQIQNSEAFKKGDSPIVAKWYRLIFSKYVAKAEDAKKIALAFTPQAALNGFKIDDIFTNRYLLKEYDLRADLSTLNIPTLVIQGASDPIPAWTAQEIADAIPHSEIVILNDCGHFPYIEKPTEFFNSLKRFLAIGTTT